ncbi:molecular chaperone DnaK [Thermobispora bispora]|jgi:DnaK suppressor protein|uniref:Transcriptional regulator, TraR/DksA family n=1 Tax=Thermobispora bispora (strain ATCC 19993 / DSM 43833 / CBS 139.67 / JCM 10125 / KCTC 9307 / NBRC 14880 / R51) TaxID=469371 RepID=D6YAX9_THEBD|nr:TraR/DksA C4-type zinc finger protein [Thermobispora bispora]ADG88346.1 transcriptional regulator, TraR/DksA family [Thermobispora bispora DSM 43833]MBO2474950.1 TraR/DksA family transcriptional regulator [Actinomycetales bacterium]MDI9579118.1 TraR/DksA C4-type zinc finger protein [Thermobispora sp.]QSI48163.1 TraR/DksA family transcriptional regulator [Thermobispora bispora]
MAVSGSESTGLSEVQVQAIREELEEQLEWRNSQLKELRAVVDTGGAEDTARLAVLNDIAATEQAVRELEATLERLKDGTYGRCDDCGSAIPFNRLKIRPLARYCINCQRRHEVR